MTLYHIDNIGIQHIQYSFIKSYSNIRKQIESGLVTTTAQMCMLLPIMSPIHPPDSIPNAAAAVIEQSRPMNSMAPPYANTYGIV